MASRFNAKCQVIETKRSEHFHLRKRTDRLNRSMASDSGDTVSVAPECDASTINEIIQRIEVLAAVSMVAVGHLIETEILVKIEVSIEIEVLMENESSVAIESLGVTESSEVIGALERRKRSQRMTSIACSSAKAKAALDEDRPA